MNWKGDFLLNVSGTFNYVLIHFKIGFYVFHFLKILRLRISQLKVFVGRIGVQRFAICKLDWLLVHE